MGSIKNWVEKCGYSIYKEPLTQYQDDNYAVITDESMMIGSEKMLLTLGVKAEKEQERALSFQDIDVLDISIERSWNGDKIAKVWDDIEMRVGKAPSYVISDNASILSKAVREKQYEHIPDISHTLAMFVERKYKNNPAFIAYTKALAGVKFRENMKLTSYLLPPKQRVVARFMNISPCVSWSKKILRSFNTLSKIEQGIFSFIKDHITIIDELDEITQASDTIASCLKNKGLSVTTIQECDEIIQTMRKSIYTDVVELSENYHQYLLELQDRLPNDQIVWHASSDIIESCFGKYKGRKSCNPLDGVTRQVLILPILSKMDPNTRISNIDFKKALEKNLLSDLTKWATDKLTENMSVKRRRVLNAA